MEADLVMYGAATGKTRSGAYLFLPDREASSIVPHQRPTVGVVSGHLVQGVRASYDIVSTTVELHSPPAVTSYGLSVHSSVDIRSLSNKVS